MFTFVSITNIKMKPLILFSSKITFIVIALTIGHIQASGFLIPLCLVSNFQTFSTINLPTTKAMSKETYYPKALARFFAKRNDALILKTISLDTVIRMLLESKVLSGKAQNPRRKLKSIRKTLDELLPRELHCDLIRRCVDRWIGAEKIIKVLEILDPRKVIGDELDLIGSFRYAYGCYVAGTRLFWSNGTIDRLNFNREHCVKLYEYFPPRSAGGLKRMALSTDRHALKDSNFPSILARAHYLTNVTILNGCTNHVLRILGLNCPNLKFLDVSHSQAITDVGLRGLLLKHPRRFGIYEINQCAKTLCRMVTIGTDISYLGAELASDILDIGYSISFLPDSVLFRPPPDVWGEPYFINTGFTTLNQECLEICSTVLRRIHIVVTRFTEKRRGYSDFHSIDVYGNGEKGLVVVRPVASGIAQAILKIQLNQITELILCWDSFTWTVLNLPELTEVGVTLPNLKVLKARIQGVWEREDTLFPHLIETCVWTVSDDTAMSFLRFCPRIETFKFNCLSMVDSGSRLTDDSLKECLLKNPTLMKNVKEMCIRPASLLGVETVSFLLKHCPSMTRLGDMESWNLCPNQIRKINRTLDKTNSKCVLTVLSFPPRETPDFLI